MNPYAPTYRLARYDDNGLWFVVETLTTRDGQHSRVCHGGYSSRPEAETALRLCRELVANSEQP